MKIGDFVTWFPSILIFWGKRDRGPARTTSKQSCFLFFLTHVTVSDPIKSSSEDGPDIAFAHMTPVSERIILSKLILACVFRDFEKGAIFTILNPASTDGL